ncbi:hypothetical protein [Streptomyces sp. NPDC050504]|uniref:hypothetical protein n=1 Tax=Streptomyces sp. NPDC050504 TaxID=3365618 RepID=UPI003787ADCF
MTSIEQIETLATFGAVGAVLSVGHSLADHVIRQTDRQATGMAAPSAAEVADGVNPRRGWGACLGHCISVWLAAYRAIGQPVLSPIKDTVTRRIPARQLS